MNYKQLKKIIKNIDGIVDYEDMNPNKVPEEISGVVSQFFFEIDRDIERVDGFYNNKYGEYNRRFNTIMSVLGLDSSLNIHHKIESNEELDEIVSILMELRNVYRNLKWFGELNHKGFIKILKKLDKKLLHLQAIANEQLVKVGEEKKIQLPTHNRENYLTTRVNALPFANEIELQRGLETINLILNELGEVEEGSQLVDISAKNGTAIQGPPFIHEQKIVSKNESLKLAKNFDFLKLKNRRYSFDQSTLDTFYAVIEEDDSKMLLQKLLSVEPSKLTDRFLSYLLSKSCFLSSLDCIDTLIDFHSEKCEQDKKDLALLLSLCDISGRNFFHQFTIGWGKSQSKQEKNHQITPGESTEISRMYKNSGGPDGIQLNEVKVSGFEYLLKCLENRSADIKKLLITRDNYLRTPLHYSSQYGLKDLTRILLLYLDRWGLIEKDASIDDLSFWGDVEGLTPIHLAIIGLHPATTENLIIYGSNVPLKNQSLLLLAVKLNCTSILNALINMGKIDINYTDTEHNCETALYVATKLNYEEVVAFLLKEGADAEIGEMVFGWTPIFIAACEGFENLVKLLIQFKAIFDLVDDSGWLPMEHACLRGHLAVADLLRPSNNDLLLYDIYNPGNNVQRVPHSTIKNSVYLLSKDDVLLSSSSIDRLPESNRDAVNEVYKQLKQLDSGTSLPKSTKQRSLSPKAQSFRPIKSFGHRYLNSEESLLMITLGTTDSRDEENPIELNKISTAKSFFTELDTALSLCITCRNKNDFQNGLIEPPVLVDLPLQDQHGSATDPITFKLGNNLSPDDIIITFDIVPTYQYSNAADLNSNNPNKKSKKILGRAIAALNTAYTKVGPHLRSLNNKITAPIIEAGSLDLLGRIRFEYLCARPFSHPAMRFDRSNTYWKQLVSTRVIGHRGLGKNMKKNSLQLGENTVESFIAAASLGASYVEFDVQLTKDFTPVVYHDFTVAESGVDIPMHALTAEQFLGLNDNDNFERDKEQKTVMIKDNNNLPLKALDDAVLGLNRRRSRSTYSFVPNFGRSHISKEEFSEDIEKEFRDEISRRMKLTKTWKDKGFKGNARGLSIASNFATLKELFKKLPQNVGFNIELKYPMLDEAEHESMGEIAIDLNFYVDTILKVVYDENVTGRHILFSSFHPDVCLLLSLKQPSFPILFLTEAGTQKMADIRASSLQSAIRFAKKWNLLGIVSAAATLVKAPRLTLVVKSSGLVCVTYGVENNSPELAKIQMKAGVDAVIADSVLAVREGLRKEQENLRELEETSSTSD